MNALSTCALVASLIFTAYSDDPFEIHVVDAETGRGVPLVE